ncbi:hypothetical protein [Ruegeria jejuensis]|uniref:hypothetical protein n=1 Tax=Ruegeria jejuensis TaxID=3233338 RepID=UPI00355BB788
MEWLVTYAGPETDDEVRGRLRDAGASVDPHRATIPMGEAERVFQISAPTSAVGRVQALPGVKGVYPNSQQIPY